MITLLKLDGAWIGAGGLPAPLAEAVAFDGPRQREEAWGWAQATMGKAARFADLLTLLRSEEQEAAPRILCTCGKVMQDGRGPQSHGVCCACSRELYLKLEGK